MSNPDFTVEEARAILMKEYGISGDLRPLSSYDDQNFHVIASSGVEYALKISGAATPLPFLTAENGAMAHLRAEMGAICPKVITAVSNTLIPIAHKNGNAYPMRLLSWMPGTVYAKIPEPTIGFHRDLGRFTGQLDKTLAAFEHSAAHRDFRWDLAQAGFVRPYLDYIPNKQDRALVAGYLELFEQTTLPQLAALPQQIIHGDLNDYNLFSDGSRATAVIDFGDMVYTARVCELAVAAAYAGLGLADPLLTAVEVVAGYYQSNPLTEQEIEQLFILIMMRLCVSVTMSSYNLQKAPENEYIQASAKPAWAALKKLAAIDPAFARAAFRHGCNLPAMAPIAPAPALGKEQILALREQHLPPSLSLSYNEPLHIVRGLGQYLYDQNGRAYLDAVNNVPHVGHCHPRVAAAEQRQAALLNTNTRYLHDGIAAYAARLAALFPDPLNVVYFVNSGSEANELALRLARTYTGNRDLIAVEGAYHGNTGELINISSYKFDGPGGRGAPPYVHIAPMPDPYRGRHRGDGAENGWLYGRYLQKIVAGMEAMGREPAAFIAEALLGCGGQIVPPDGWLQEAYVHVRAAGGVCIADEVQIGFGRVGSHWWGFEQQGIVPDIVTLGKPMGNGHPLAAVVTTSAIAQAFANGMEYFNTFGGNPVSCAVGTAVLDVIEQENLRQTALETGNYLMEGLRRLQADHPLVGDVRGRGLYIGAELVRNRKTLEPAAEEASRIANGMKEAGVLISTDGPLHNVLKIKPPLVFNKKNADFLLEKLEAELQGNFSIKKSAQS